MVNFHFYHPSTVNRYNIKHSRHPPTAAKQEPMIYIRWAEGHKAPAHEARENQSTRQSQTAIMPRPNRTIHPCSQKGVKQTIRPRHTQKKPKKRTQHKNQSKRTYRGHQVLSCYHTWHAKTPDRPEGYVQDNTGQKAEVKSNQATEKKGLKPNPPAQQNNRANTAKHMLENLQSTLQCTHEARPSKQQNRPEGHEQEKKGHRPPNTC